MKPKSYIFKVDVPTGSSLIEFLAIQLTKAMGITVSKAKVRMLTFAGAVYIDGKRTQREVKLKEGSEIKTFVDLQKLQKDKTSQQKRIELTDDDVCFEDKEIIVINKPAGIPTQATVDNARDHLYAAVKRYLSARDGGEIYVGLHHRLDYDTSGLILFTKKKFANFWVSELFKNKQIQKTYHAIVKKTSRKVGESWEIKDHISRAKNKRGGRVIHMEEVNSGGDFAHTTFKIVRDLGIYQLIECFPHTGRTHQIRIHLKVSGQPILGDVLYGGERSTRIYLHSKSVEFIHGGNLKKILVDSSYPSEFQILIK